MNSDMLAINVAINSVVLVFLMVITIFKIATILGVRKDIQEPTALLKAYLQMTMSRDKDVSRKVDSVREDMKATVKEGVEQVKQVLTDSGSIPMPKDRNNPEISR